MPKTLDERTDIRECGTGMVIELVWSDDETMVNLHVTNSGMMKGTKSLRLSSLELDELRSFLSDKLQ